jgi:hypothetical protein
MKLIALPLKILILVWFLGWGFLILQFPVQCFRLLSWGRYPTPKQLRREKFVGYMALGFGILFLLELAFGIIR